MSCCIAELKKNGFDRTNSARRSRLEGSWEPGEARWRDRGVIWDGRVGGFGRGGRVWGRPKKVNLGRKLVEMEDEGKSSCEKLRVVLAVLFWW